MKFKLKKISMQPLYNLSKSINYYNVFLPILMQNKVYCIDISEFESKYTRKWHSVFTKCTTNNDISSASLYLILILMYDIEEEQFIGLRG